jgi:hypothetical protein
MRRSLRNRDRRPLAGELTVFAAIQARGRAAARQAKAISI